MYRRETATSGNSKDKYTKCKYNTQTSFASSNFYHIFLSVPFLYSKLDTVLEGSIHYITHKKMFRNIIIMWKSVKLHFSVNTNILDFLKVNSFFHGF